MLPMEIFAIHFKRYEEHSDGVLGKNTKVVRIVTSTFQKYTSRQLYFHDLDQNCKL
jgi:hypothetical protein